MTHLSPVRLSNTVSSTITAVRAPASVGTDVQFTIEVDIETTGTGSDKQFLAIYDSDAAMYIAAGISDAPLAPGQSGTWTATIKALKDWYTSYTGKPIPSTLKWIARVGYVTSETEDGFEGMITDESSFSIITTGAPPPTECEGYTTKEECEAAGCYWWGGFYPALPAKCHSDPQPWWDKYKYYLAGVSAVGMVGIVVVATHK